MIYRSEVALESTQTDRTARHGCVVTQRPRRAPDGADRPPLGGDAIDRLGGMYALVRLRPPQWITRPTRLRRRTHGRVLRTLADQAVWWLPGAGTGRPREPHHGHEYKIIKLY